MGGPENGVENDPRRMPSRREMVERARAERLERDEEVRREAERERGRREDLEGGFGGREGEGVEREG